MSGEHLHRSMFSVPAALRGVHQPRRNTQCHSTMFRNSLHTLELSRNMPDPASAATVRGLTRGSTGKTRLEFAKHSGKVDGRNAAPILSPSGSACAVGISPTRLLRPHPRHARTHTRHTHISFRTSRVVRTHREGKGSNLFRHRCVCVCVCVWCFMALQWSAQIRVKPKAGQTCCSG